MQILPRFIRVSKAPAYLGMCRNEFNKTVRPFLREIPIGEQGKAFDRLELDEWATEYANLHGIDKASGKGNDTRSSVKRDHRAQRGNQLWHVRQSRGSNSAKASGTLISKSKGMDEFAKALTQAAARKQNDI